MKRRVFYSFHYDPDNWRAAQVRNIGSIEVPRPTISLDSDLREYMRSYKRGGSGYVQREGMEQLGARREPVGRP